MISFSCNSIVEYRRGLEVSREQHRATNMCRSSAAKRFMRENLIETAALQRVGAPLRCQRSFSIADVNIRQLHAFELISSAKSTSINSVDYVSSLLIIMM